jgi:L,D-peptidoglycan transpeptidase YkuD (ErfK/YbiS/YcfS/YnhG family)
MKKILFPFVFCISVSSAQIGGAQQLVIVVTPNWNSHSGTLFLFERTDSGWKQDNVPWSVSVGDSGLAWGDGLQLNPPGERRKVEGDHRSPAGVFEIGDFYGLDAMAPYGVRFPYHHITSTLHCVDDTGSVFYNSMVDEHDVIRDSSGRLPWKSAENLRADSADYKYMIVIRQNPTAAPDSGSCIFFHIRQTGLSSTVGCTSMDEDKMIFLMQWLDPQKYPLLVQVPMSVFNQYLLDWNLPLLSKN